MFMDNVRVYPDHIYDPTRVEIATTYLKREFRKMFSRLRGEEIWQSIDSSIDNWFPKDSEVGVRDFWNGLHGIAMGFKLKIGFLQIITAENIIWEFNEHLPLDSLLASGGNLKYISEELSEKRPRASRLKDFFLKNKQLADKWREEFTEHGFSSETRDQYPIICAQEEDNNEKIYSVYDGNRRMVLAILEGKKNIPAYIGRYSTGEFSPENFWIPTSFLMELVEEGELAVGENGYQQTLEILRNLIKLSTSGKYELLNRVLIGHNEFRKKLKEDLELLG